MKELTLKILLLKENISINIILTIGILGSNNYL